MPNFFSKIFIDSVLAIHQFLQLKYLAVPGLADAHLCRARNALRFTGLLFLIRLLGSP